MYRGFVNYPSHISVPIKTSTLDNDLISVESKSKTKHRLTQQYLFHLGVVEPVEVKPTLHIETLTAGTFVRFFIVVNKHMDRFYLFVFEIAVTIYTNVFLLVGSIVRACAQYLKQHVHTLDNFVKGAN